jgi:hypothetical protein
MATQIKPTKKNSSPMRTGMAKNNKPAEAYQMNGVGADKMRKAVGHGGTDPNTMKANEFMPGKPTARVSLGNPDSQMKTDGIEVRGSGAATKGRMARGPMA